MRTHTHRRYEQDGTFSETTTPWGVHDYLGAIKDLENEVTARLIRNATLGDEYAIGELTRIESGIQVLRDEKNAL